MDFGGEPELFSYFAEVLTRPIIIFKNGFCFIGTGVVFGDGPTKMAAFFILSLLWSFAGGSRVLGDYSHSMFLPRF